MEHTQWQSLLTLGNQCFYEKKWSQAEFFYGEAHDLLAFAYSNDPLSSDTLMAWICTCHNLSSLYEEMGNLDLALRYLMVPHEYLKEINESEVPNDEVKLIAFKAMSTTLNPILLFAKNHPIYKDKLTVFKEIFKKSKSTVH